MAPDAWLSSTAAALPSVDVDSLPAYSHLLQEVLVLAPGLLEQSPGQAAASLATLERFTRSSAVWFGPAMVAQTLATHTPASLQQHLGQLMEVTSASRPLAGQQHGPFTGRTGLCCNSVALPPC